MGTVAGDSVAVVEVGMFPGVEVQHTVVFETKADSRKQTEWLDQLAPDFKGFLPLLMQGLKGPDPNQLLPALPPARPPREPTAIFCIKLLGDPSVKRVEGTVAAFTATGQLVVLIGNEVVGKFESVESWWGESGDGLLSTLSRREFLNGRVPGVYLASANLGVLALFALCVINNLHGFNRVFSSIPTASTNHFHLL